MYESAAESLTVASVLAEVSRPYSKRVMNNVHRSDYVEAIVALALRDSGWSRTEPWDAWDCEHASGARLEVKQSAAAQAWASGGRHSPPRFDIRPRTGYWDEEGEWVSKRGRHADVYVFAWHGEPQETADQRGPGKLGVLRDPGTWSTAAEEDRLESGPGPDESLWHLRGSRPPVGAVARPRQ